MDEKPTELKCPSCQSNRLTWRGIENDVERNHSGQNLAVIHKWQCFKCGATFKQRLD